MPGTTPKNPFILLALLLFSSCVFLTEGSVLDFANQNNFLNRFPENQKAIVIVKVNGSANTKVWWCNQKNLVSQNDDSCFQFYTSDGYRILMLEPGNYYFLKHFRNYRPLFSPTQEIHEQMRYLTVFTAKAGEIIYAGDLSLKGFNAPEEEGGKVDSIGSFMVRDNFDALKKLLENENPKKTDKLFANQIWEKNYLIKEYPNLKKRLKKGLVKSFRLDWKMLDDRKIVTRRT